MMKKINILMTLLALSTSVTFADGLYPIDPSKPATIHPESNCFSIELPSNPTTGYQWKVLSVSEGIKINQKVFMAPDQPCCGAPGIEQLDVVLTKTFPGSGTIEMQYQRHWENDADQQSKPIVIKIEK